MLKTINVNKYDSIIISLILFLPFLMITGTFLPDLCISIIAFLFLFKLDKSKFQKYFLNKFTLSFLFLAFYFIVLSLFSDNVLLSLESSLFYSRFILFSIAIWYILENYHKVQIYFTYSILLIFIFVIFDAYLQYFTGKNLLGFEYNGYRLSGIFKDELILGSFISRLLPLVLGLCVYTFYKKKYLALLIFFILILSDILVFLSGERSAFFFITLASILFIFVLTKWKMMRIFSLILSFFSILLILNLNPEIKKRMVDDTVDSLQITSDNKVIFSTEHEALYLNAFSIYKDNLIFGIGPKLFRLYCDYPDYKSRFGCSTHPHNTYVQLLLETGILGFLFFIFIFIFISFIFLKQVYFQYIKKIQFLSDYQLLLLISIYISLWPFSPSSNFFGNYINIIYFLPVGFFLNSIYNKNSIKI